MSITCLEKKELNKYTVPGQFVLLCIIWQCWMECSDMLCPFLLQILWEFGKRNSSVERCHLLTFLEMLPSCLLSSRYCYHHNFLQPKLCLLCIAMRYFGFTNVFQNRNKPRSDLWSRFSYFQNFECVYIDLQNYSKL